MRSICMANNANTYNKKQYSILYRYQIYLQVEYCSYDSVCGLLCAINLRWCLIIRFHLVHSIHRTPVRVEINHSLRNQLYAIQVKVWHCTYYRYPIGTYNFTTAESDARMTSQVPHTGQLAYDVHLEVDLTCSVIRLWSDIQLL